MLSSEAAARVPPYRGADPPCDVAFCGAGLLAGAARFVRRRHLPATCR
jgi:hypothetical protein